MTRFTIGLAALALSATTSAVTVTNGVAYSTAGTTYTQNFNSLSATATTEGFTNNSTLPGWYVETNTYGAAGNLFIGTGSSGTSYLYDFGSYHATDRALGSIDGTPSPYIAPFIIVGFTNLTGTTLNGFTFNYTGEEWHGGSATGAIDVYYGQGALPQNVTTWTAAGAASAFVPPNTTGSGALDGNAAGNRETGLGGTFTDSWAAGTTLYIRFAMPPGNGGGDGLAIDDFSFSATAASAVPEPSTYAAVLGGVALAVVGLRRRVALDRP